MISQEALKALLDGKVIRRVGSRLTLNHMQKTWDPLGYVKIWSSNPAVQPMFLDSNANSFLLLLQDDWEPVPPALMNWAEARAAMESGKKVTRNTYGVNCPAFALRTSGFAVVREEDGSWFPLGLDDLDASDWYVVE